MLKSGDISDLLDPSLDVKHDEVEVRRMSLAASLCLGRSARLRPRISQVRLPAVPAARFLFVFRNRRRKQSC